MSLHALPTATPIVPGQILAGKYQVERVLGAGGMGIVVAARHLELEERVAVKLLLDASLGADEGVARFMREARAAVKIKSEHVARIIDVGRLENDAPYIVMEYLEGSDLAELVEGGRLPPAQAVDYVLQACEAMSEAHALGIIHRDLKPANLFLARRSDGSTIVKVLDFGISKVQGLDGVDGALTKTSAVLGSPFYMSPEQMHSAREVDHRTDIWSLGVILYELVAGRPPFQGETFPQVLSAIVLARPTPLSELAVGVSPALDAIVLRALSKDPALRFGSVAELARALAPHGPPSASGVVERMLRRSGGLGSSPPAASAAVSVPARPAADGLGETVADWAQTNRGRPSRARTMTTLGIGTLALLTAGVVGASMLRSPAPAAILAVTAASASIAPLALAPLTSSPQPVLPVEVPAPPPVSLTVTPANAQPAASTLEKVAADSPQKPALTPARAGTKDASRVGAPPKAETTRRHGLNLELK